MKPLLILILITSLYAEKIVKIKINNYQFDVKFKNITIEHNNYIYYLEDRKGNKFFMKNFYPKGETITAKTIETKFINNKKIRNTYYEKYKIYNLKCIKENDVYFDCIE